MVANKELFGNVYLISTRLPLSSLQMINPFRFAEVGNKLLAKPRKS